jgi:hypothetical protein
MSDSLTPENASPTTSSDAQTISEMRAAIESLRGVFQVVALSGIVLSATFLMYFYRQVSAARRQNDDLKAYIIDYNTNILPKIEMSRTNLEAFAKSNPTVLPILRKYFATNAPASTPPPPPSTAP